MARIRQIKPSYFVDDDIATLSPHARIMFIGLWCLADREGRLEDKPISIKLQTLPLDQVDANAVLDELAGKGLVNRYSANGKRCILVRGFTKHQHTHQNEAPSSLPPPVGDGPQSTAAVEPPTVSPHLPGTYSNGRSPQEKVHRTRGTSTSSSTFTSTSTSEKDSAPASPSPFDGLLNLFKARWAKSYKRPYPDTGADRSNLGRFMKQLPQYIEGWTGTVDRYLSDRDSFLMNRSNNHSLTWLVTKGMSKYGGTPRESYEEAVARFNREHAARKVASGQAAKGPVSELIKALADAHSIEPYDVDAKENEAKNRIAAQLAERKAAEERPHG